uniref:Uncharacterized protein n=1 Tax=Ascaris lumbricoides TaxID=6252 RepID=A0A9J2PYM4_ASCLU
MAREKTRALDWRSSAEKKPEVDAPNEDRHCQQMTRTNDHSEAMENSNPVTQLQPSSKSSTVSILLSEMQP